ncbi:biliverdin-producing heme oxygenase [Solilutibacter tolerans]|uniref:Heme oxygenase n=1 Tax=Solilutibacter tolerans TaxID=1604334 RepID=A0A1N6RLZ9_9GAMM|nr:biliverdin-producing heme oxygenase [Lysobacter tolerans]SIQ29894.1 Heme oxygenase [Lysobacter tolerans]
MTPRTAAHTRLREATAVDHARVDGCFPHGLQDAAAYRRYLRGMHALLTALSNRDEQLNVGYAIHRQHLADDLLALDARSASLPSGIDILDPHARLGVRYVIEGSALSARLLLRQAEALGHHATSGATFLTHHVDRGITHWPRLMQALAQHDPATSDFKTVIASARNTFALAASCFDPMGSAGDVDEGQDRK